MRIYLAVALFVVSVPAVAFAETPESGSTAAGSATAYASSSSSSNATPDDADITGADVLFGGTPSYGVYLGSSMEASSIKRQSGVFLGARGGLIVSEVLTLGGGMSWLVDGPRVGVDGTPAIRMRHGGGLLGLTLASDQVIHPTVEVLFGGGKVSYDYGRTRPSGEDANVFVVDTTAGFDINVTHGIRFHFGGGFRHVSNFELNGLTDEDVDGFYGAVQLKFGSF